MTSVKFDTIKYVSRHGQPVARLTALYCQVWRVQVGFGGKAVCVTASQPSGCDWYPDSEISKQNESGDFALRPRRKTQTWL
jgi:hypothetical protein